MSVVAVQKDELRARFHALWNRTAIPQHEVASPYDYLVGRYTERHRHYHTLKHINHCLAQVDLARPGIPDPDSVEMAIWFHDIVYDTQANDNERRSAEVFFELSQQASADFRQKVYDLIMITVHPSTPSGLDQQYMVDIDLSSFGMPWEDFVADSDAVRREYAHIPIMDFRRGQKEFLKALCQKEFFYHTEFFRSRYEQSARRNIERQIGGFCRT